MSNSTSTNLQAASAAASDSRSTKSFTWAAAGGILGACGIAITSCCIVPLLFLSVGLGGAWMGSLAVLAPYKPLFIVLTAALLGYGYYVVYFASKRCADDDTCAALRTTRKMKLVLWGVTALALAGWASQHFEPYLIAWMRSA